MLAILCFSRLRRVLTPIYNGVRACSKIDSKCLRTSEYKTSSTALAILGSTGGGAFSGPGAGGATGSEVEAAAAGGASFRTWPLPFVVVEPAKVSELKPSEPISTGGSVGGNDDIVRSWCFALDMGVGGGWRIPMKWAEVT